MVLCNNCFRFTHPINSQEDVCSQVDHEGLAIIFGVLKFCQYLLGRSLRSELIINLLFICSPQLELLHKCHLLEYSDGH